MSGSAQLKTVGSVGEAGLPEALGAWVAEVVALCKPADLYVCTGTEAEAAALCRVLQDAGMAKPLTKYNNCWLTRTDPADVARVESKTVIVTPDKRDAVPEPKEGVEGQLNRWMSPAQHEEEKAKRWPGCMAGRTLYVVPFCMGPITSPLAKIGVELTDSAYVAASMGIMARMGSKVLEAIAAQTEPRFTKALHSVGVPLPTTRQLKQNWPCNPELTLISHEPTKNEVWSFGSGYGGNSLLGKKCLALRIAMWQAAQEGWMAEHMLIIGITPPSGKKHYIAAAFPSQCGKTNMAMMLPTIPGYKMECVGDDIAWMKFDKEGRLRAINPETGFFGVAPGSSQKTLPNAMTTIESNTLFTNVAETEEGGFYWEGLEDVTPETMKILDWQGKEWTRGCGRPASHPNARFCSPLAQLPSLDPAAEDPQGVPIEAVLFGGRRPHGFPLVMESFGWEHGVYYGAAMSSEKTAAAEHTGDGLLHDPFALRPFFSYNLGKYMQHWLDMPRLFPNAQLPKIYHVNWFRKDEAGHFLWPGFGENSRVLDWIIKRLEAPGSSETGVRSPVGVLPKKEAFNLAGLAKPVDWAALFKVDKAFWLDEADKVHNYYAEQLPHDMPKEIEQQITDLKARVNAEL